VAPELHRAPAILKNGDESGTPLHGSESTGHGSAAGRARPRPSERCWTGRAQPLYEAAVRPSIPASRLGLTLRL
jgi:hypothetical protein